VNCREFVDQITPAVDNMLPPSELERFLSHASACARCRELFEAERGIVSLVHARLPQVSAPRQLMSRITSDIETVVRSERAGFLGSLLHSIYFRPALGLGLGLAGVAFLLMRTPTQHRASEQIAQTIPPAVAPAPVKKPADADIVRQSMKHYDRVVKGTIAPQVVSNLPERVRSYFAGRTEFPVLVPTMKECTLVGGVIDDAYGERMAHLMYRHGNDTIAMTQTARESVMHGERLSLSDSARAQLERKGWYREDTPDGRTVLVWVRGGTICAAVTRREDDAVFSQMIQSLSDSTAW
jgi:hypothetical protein